MVTALDTVALLSGYIPLLDQSDVSAFYTFVEQSVEYVDSSMIVSIK